MHNCSIQSILKPNQVQYNIIILQSLKKIANNSWFNVDFVFYNSECTAIKQILYFIPINKCWYLQYAFIDNIFKKYPFWILYLSIANVNTSLHTLLTTQNLSKHHTTPHLAWTSNDKRHHNIGGCSEQQWTVHNFDHLKRPHQNFFAAIVLNGVIKYQKYSNNCRW